MRKYKNYTDEQIIELCKKVNSMSQLLQELNLKPAGGNFANMKKILQRLNIDNSHWVGQAWNKSQRLKNWQDYSRSVNMKPHLIKERGNKCQQCGLEIWYDKPIKLELHHIDGDRTNNDIRNIILLCPNCHSYTDSWKKQKSK